MSEWSCRKAAGGIPESAREPSPVYPSGCVGTFADPNAPQLEGVEFTGVLDTPSTCVLCLPLSSRMAREATFAVLAKPRPVNRVSGRAPPGLGIPGYTGDGSRAGSGIPPAALRSLYLLTHLQPPLTPCGVGLYRIGNSQLQVSATSGPSDHRAEELSKLRDS